MFYHSQCDQIVSRYKQGSITKEVAYKLLWEIEKKAYRKIPDAELDGDITYAVASAIGEINENN